MAGRADSIEHRIPSQKLRKALLRALIAALLVIMPFTQSSFGLNGLHETLEQIGQYLIVLAIVGRGWCTLYIGGRKFSEIIMSGPYSVSRNPLYMFSVLGAFGAGLQSGSLLFGLAVLVTVWLILDSTVRKEERSLVARFGQPYRDYRRRVPRYGPRLSAWMDEARVIVHLPLLYRTLVDGLMFYAVVPVAELADWLQRAGHLPVLLHLPI